MMPRLSRFLAELKRRRVYHAVVVYAAAAFVAAQAAEIFLPRLGLPDWTVTLVVVLAVAGFPVALILGWVFDVTPEGVRRTARAPSDRPAPGQRRVAIGTAAAVLVLALGGWWLSSLAFSAPLPAEKRIAVLPFHPVSDDPRTRALADGLSESLTSRLTQLDGLRGTLWVIPSAEVRGLGVASPSHARREFGVNLAITGSVRHTGDSVWVEASLVDADRLRQLRSWTLDEPLTDVAAIQAGILRSFHDLLDLELAPDERRALVAGGTSDPAAYEDQLAAVGFLERFEQVENVDEAIRHFHSALDRDPDYVLALAGLARARLRRYEHTLEAPNLERAHELIERALELDDDVAQAHLTRGLVLAATGRHNDAVAAFQRALELEPFSEEALSALGSAYHELGDPDRAEATLRRAVALRPGWWTGHNALGVFYYRQGRYDDAAEQFRRVLVLTPDNSRGWSNLGGIHYMAGRIDEAIDALERSVELSPTADGLSNIGTIYYYLARYEEAARAYEAALELNDRSPGVWNNLASAYGRIPGREDDARAAWERVVNAASAALDVNPQDPDVLLYLAGAHAYLDEPDRARGVLRRVVDLAGGEVNYLYRAGEVYEWLGDRDAAIRWIGEALRRGYSREAFERAPDLEELRSDPRFLEAIALP